MQITKTKASLFVTFFGSKIHLMTKCNKNPFCSRPYLISCSTKAHILEIRKNVIKLEIQLCMSSI